MSRGAARAALTLALGIVLGACSEGDAVQSVALGTPITVAQAGQRDVPMVLTAMGRVASSASPRLSAEVDGQVLSLGAEEGDSVKEGQVLAELESLPLVLGRDAARARRERSVAAENNARRRVERLRELHRRGSVSRQQLDDAESELTVFGAERSNADARLGIFEGQLSKATVRAPVAGRIEKRLVSAGDFVKRGDPLFDIATSDRLRVLLPFPETQAGLLKPGLVVSLSSPLTPEQWVRGVVTELRPEVDAANRAIWAIIDFYDPVTWRPEATVRGDIVVATHANAVVVPEKAVGRRPAGDVVYIIENERAIQRVVSIGEPIDELVEIRDGVSTGETVAVEGAAYLSDGAAVRIPEATP